MTLRRPAGALLVVYLLVAVLEQFAGAWHWRIIDTICLALLMPVLIAFLLVARRRPDRLTTLTAVALFWSWLGDTVGGLGLLLKIALFLVAQSVFAVAFWPCRRGSVLRRPVLLVVYLVCLTGMIVLVARVAGAFLPAVVVYGCALGLMAVLASGVNRYAAIGAIAFVVSDLALALGLFDAAAAAALSPIVMPTYLAAQFLLVWGVLRRQRGPQPATASAQGAPAASKTLR